MIVYYHLMLVVHDGIYYYCIIINKCINCYPVKLGIYKLRGLTLLQGTVFLSHSHWGLSTH